MLVTIVCDSDICFVDVGAINLIHRHVIAAYNSFLEGFNRVAELSLHAKGAYLPIYLHVYIYL